MMILKLLFMSDLWLSIININNARHAKKRQARINVFNCIKPILIDKKKYCHILGTFYSLNLTVKLG